jgi:hypothetical protein
MATLAELQTRFHALCTDPRADLGLADGLVRPTAAMTASERVGVYARMYTARLHDVLVDEFPMLHRALDPQAFDQLVLAYLRDCPPRHASVREVGDRLAGYLVDRPEARRRPWLVDLARLERTATELFDAADADVLTVVDLQQLPMEHWPELQVRLVPAHALLELATRADRAHASLEHGRAPRGVRKPCTLLVWRPDVHVVWREVTADEAELLRSAVLGATLAELCEIHAAERDTEDTAVEVAEFLAGWVGAGLVRLP